MKRSDGAFMEIFKKLMNRRGTTLTEYGLILLLIALVVIVAIKMVGNSTNNLYSTVNAEVVKAGS